MWKDEALIEELDKEYKDWEEGRITGYSLEDVKASIDKLRQGHRFGFAQQ